MNFGETIKVTGEYSVECFDSNGALKWKEEIKNLVVTVGKNYMLDKTFAGSSYTAAWYLGLVNGASTPSYDEANTMSSHSGWTEFTGYGNSTRPLVTWNAASSGSKSSNPTSFNINSPGTIAGAFMTTDNTIGGITGTLYSAGDFAVGSQAVTSGDTLNVTYTATLT